ncbi:CG1999 [Drosophila busckii]|uniref:CG1999 n=2 Tax=Drosophila busckii TaxID=30019 RepID=A0A0M3QZP8_DROBS|nr:CG1999 [Drosophila busckii]
MQLRSLFKCCYSTKSGGGAGKFGTWRITNIDAPRKIMREDNMWRSPLKTDTKWLRSHDAHQYRPDFGQTEPQSLRKQFMRSPDERTRDALGRDWDLALKKAINNRREMLLAEEQRNKELEMERERATLERRPTRRQQAAALKKTERAAVSGTKQPRGSAPPAPDATKLTTTEAKPRPSKQRLAQKRERLNPKADDY